MQYYKIDDDNHLCISQNFPKFLRLVPKYQYLIYGDQVRNLIVLEEELLASLRHKKEEEREREKEGSAGLNIRKVRHGLESGFMCDIVEQ